MMIQRFGMICLMLDFPVVRSATSLHSFRKKLKIYLPSKKHTHPICFLHSLSVELWSCILLYLKSMIIDFSLYGAPRVCLLMEIKRYKNTIRNTDRIRILHTNETCIVLELQEEFISGTVKELAMLLPPPRRLCFRLGFFFFFFFFDFVNLFVIKITQKLIATKFSEYV